MKIGVYMAMNRSSHIPLYIQLKDELKEKIKNKTYNINDTIPSEKELMEIYMVGRVTVREAINQLVSEGRLEKRQGIGTFVKEPKKAVGFQPFISLSYSLQGTDIDPINKVTFEKLVILNKEEQLLTQMSKEKAFRFKRCRYIDQHPMILEDFYFHESFYEKTKEMDLETSIGRILVEELDIEIVKLSQEVDIRKSTKEENKLLKLHDDEVLHTKRWMFVKSLEQPYQYYEMIVPVSLAGYPFQHSH